MPPAYLRQMPVAPVAERVHGVCDKHGFPDAARARAVARRADYGVGVYRCPVCHRWHVGRPGGASVESERAALVRHQE
jgi:hypothetical protein